MRPWEDEGQGGVSAIWTQSPFPLRSERSGMKTSALAILVALNKVGKKRIWIVGSCPCVPNNTVYWYIYLDIFCLQIPGDKAHSVVFCWGMMLKEAEEAALAGRLSKEDSDFLKLFRRY